MNGRKNKQFLSIKEAKELLSAAGYRLDHSSHPCFHGYTAPGELSPYRNKGIWARFKPYEYETHVTNDFYDEFIYENNEDRLPSRSCTFAAECQISPIA